MLIRRGRVGVVNCRECNTPLNVASLAPFTVVECPACKTRTRVPVQYAHFHLQDRAGEDRLGALFIAFDTTLHRYILLRTLDPAINADKPAAAAFLAAARASSSVNHRQVLQVFSAAEHDGGVYVAMEHTQGGRLVKALEGGRTLPENRAVRMALDVALGLQAAHAAGLVHGDVSPEHIHLDNAGGAKIGEFGTHAVGAVAGHNGDPRFIAPECARGGTPDARADFYTLGAVLFFALTGRAPFEGATRADMIAARLKQPAPSVRSLVPAVSAATDRVVARMLQQDPARRHPNAASLISDLRAALEPPADAAAPAPSGSAHGPAAAPAAKSRGAGLWITVGVAVVAVGIGLFIAMGRKGDEAKPSVAPPPVATPPSAPVAKTPVASSEVPAALQQAFQDVALSLKDGDPERARGIAHKAAAAATDDAGRAWMQTLEGLATLAAGHENDAWTQFFEIGHRKIAPGTPAFAQAPILFARVAVGDLEPGQARTRGEGWPGWYRPLLDLFTAAGALAWRDASAATEPMQNAAAGLAKEASWAAGFAPVAASWSASMTSWGQLKARLASFTAPEQAPEAWNLLTADASLRNGLMRRAVLAEMARAVEAIASGKWPAKASSETIAMLATADIRPLTLDVSGELSIEKPLATGPLTKTGPGTLTLNGPQPFAGGLNVLAGRVVAKGGGWTEPSGAGRGIILVSTGAVLETTGTHQFDGAGSQTELRLRGGRAVFPNECYIRILDLCGGRLETRRDVRIRYEVRVWASEQPSEVAGELAGMLRSDPIKVFVEDGPASPDFRLGGARGTGIRKEGPGQMELRGPVENTLILGSGSLRWPAQTLKIGRLEGRGVVLRPVATASAQAALDVQGQATFVNKLAIEPIDEAGRGWKPDAPVRWAVIRAQGGVTLAQAPQAPPGWKIEADANAVYASYTP